MTILPKKKPTQNSSSAEVDNAENSTNSNLQHQLSPIGTLPSHIQSGDSSSRNSWSSQSPPPCWPPPPSSSAGTRDDKRPTHQSPSPYEEAHEGGPSHGKRRYRTSPLNSILEVSRSVRPKLRDHRGSSSPPYPSTSTNWNVKTHPLSHAHQLRSIPALQASLSPQAGPSRSPDDEDFSGYNSGDEYEPYSWDLTKDEWEEKERWFEKKMRKKGFIIKKMEEDGACLFRAIADQVYGDQEMHSVVRGHCMNYIERNQDAFAPFVSENFQTYIQRKKRDDCFGNHIEIAAMSEMYNRIIEVYCYRSDPINIFQGCLQTDNEPIRLTYHWGTHYNSLVDPYKATVGVGLGLPSFQPGLAEKTLVIEATQQSENLEIEQAMLEDKIRATDYEATSEAIEEQVAKESYIEWLKENEKRNKSQLSPSSSSGCGGPSGNKSPRGRNSPHNTSNFEGDIASNSSRNFDPPKLSPRSSPRISFPSKSSDPQQTKCTSISYDLAIPGSSKDEAVVEDFIVNENATFLNHFPPDVFGLNDYAREEADILAQVLAASQQEYLDSLKNRKEETELVS